MEADRLSEVLGRTETVLEGEVIAQESAGLMLEVPASIQVVGNTVQRLNQRVTLPRTGVSFLEVRRLDRLKTGAVVALTAAVVGVAAAAAFEALGDPSREGGSKGGVDRSVGLLFQLQLPISRALFGS